MLYKTIIIETTTYIYYLLQQLPLHFSPTLSFLFFFFLLNPPSNLFIFIILIYYYFLYYIFFLLYLLFYFYYYTHTHTHTHKLALVYVSLLQTDIGGNKIVETKLQNEQQTFKKHREKHGKIINKSKNESRYKQ